jgi:phage-related minor tail protein
MGVIDKVFRVLLAAVVLVLYFTRVITGTRAIILLILAGILVLSSIIGSCPFCLPFSIKNKKKE